MKQFLWSTAGFKSSSSIQDEEPVKNTALGSYASIHWKDFLWPTKKIEVTNEKCHGLVAYFTHWQKRFLIATLAFFAVIMVVLGLDNVVRLHNTPVALFSLFNFFLFAGFLLYTRLPQADLRPGRYFINAGLTVTYIGACFFNGELPFVFCSLVLTIYYLLNTPRNAFKLSSVLIIGSLCSLWLSPSVSSWAIVSREVVELVVVFPFLHFIMCFSRWMVELYGDQLRSKTHFVNTVSHEIRAPLSGMVGLTSILQDSTSEIESEQVRDRIQSHLQRLEELQEHLTGIVNNSLQLSQIREGTLRVTNDRISLKPLVESAVSVFKDQCDQKHIRLSCYVSKNCSDISVKSDPLKIHQLISNLVSNAVKYTDIGQVRVNALIVQSNGVDSVKVAVQDTGIGIPKDKQYKLFEVFQQLHHQEEHLTRGTGLGLALVKELTLAMGGQCGFVSTEGRGSLFWFSVPVESIKQDEVTNPIEPELSDKQNPPNIGGNLQGMKVPVVDDDPIEPELSDKQNPPNIGDNLQGMKVLVVDDDPIVRKMHRLILEKYGVEVHQAENGLIAVESVRMQERHFDLILMDLQMPVMGGVEALGKIRQIHGYEKAPILCITGAVALDETNALTSGFTELLPKPVKPNVLCAKAAYYALTGKLGLPG